MPSRIRRISQSASGSGSGSGRHDRRWGRVLVRGLAGAWLFWLLALSGSAFAHGPTIEISHAEMKPALLNLFVGTTVHFLNTVEMPGGHVVVDQEGRIESPALEHPGDDWHYTFAEEGVYEIFVRQHPGARARIVVVPKRTTPGS